MQQVFAWNVLLSTETAQKKTFLQWMTEDQASSAGLVGRLYTSSFKNSEECFFLFSLPSPYVLLTD